MNTERDKFLTEAMGECWHEWEERTRFHVDREYFNYCVKCNKDEMQLERRGKLKPIDFNSWEGFGKLLEWCQKQDDMTLAQNKMSLAYLTPDRFADSIYRYLLKKEEIQND